MWFMLLRLFRLLSLLRPLRLALTSTPGPSNESTCRMADEPLWLLSLLSLFALGGLDALVSPERLVRLDKRSHEGLLRICAWLLDRTRFPRISNCRLLRLICRRHSSMHVSMSQLVVMVISLAHVAFCPALLARKMSSLLMLTMLFNADSVVTGRKTVVSPDHGWLSSLSKRRVRLGMISISCWHRCLNSISNSDPMGLGSASFAAMTGSKYGLHWLTRK